MPPDEEPRASHTPPPPKKPGTWAGIRGTQTLAGQATLCSRGVSSGGQAAGTRQIREVTPSVKGC